MSLVRPVDERSITVSITDEAVVIPSSASYVKRVAEVPVQADLVSVRRITPTIKTGTGSGSCQSLGNYAGSVTKDYRVEIDTAGELGVGATFKWGTVSGGVTTWRGSLIPISDTAAIDLELNVQVAFASGTGTDFQIGDYWTFSAEFWTEVTSVPIATKTFQVDYSKGDLTFYSADAGLTVYVSYEGRGSLMKAADLLQVIDPMIAGQVTMYNVNTSALAVKKMVSIDGSGSLIYANASTMLKPAVGMARAISATEGEVVILGPFDGLVGLIPGKMYYLDTVDGDITDIPPSMPGCLVQPIGVALTVTKLFLHPMLETQMVNQVVIGGINTSGFSLRECVGILGGITWQESSDDPAYNHPAIGFVKTVHATRGEVLVFGALDGFAGLTAGDRYYVGHGAGSITSTPPTSPGLRVQIVGCALTTTQLLVSVSLDWKINP